MGAKLRGMAVSCVASLLYSPLACKLHAFVYVTARVLCACVVIFETLVAFFSVAKCENLLGHLTPLIAFNK